MVAVNFFLCAVLLGAEPAVAEKPAPQAQPQDQAADLELLTIEKNIVEQTNAQRARYGLSALKIDKSLMESARNHASWMARTRNLVHTNLPVAENIAMGQHDSTEAVRSWMNSSGHRANILNSGHGKIGVAAFRTESGTIFWCQQFRR